MEDGVWVTGAWASIMNDDEITIALVSSPSGDADKIRQAWKRLLSYQAHLQFHSDL